MNKEYFMLLLVDEVLSLNEEDEMVREASLKGKYTHLQDAIRFIKPGISPKKLIFKDPTMDGELEYFTNLFKDHDKIIYFYDERFVSGEMLDRLQNWLLPNKVLWPIPIRGNKAEYLFLKNEIQKIIHNGVNYNDVMNHIQNMKSKISSWVISPSPMKVIRANKYSAIYKEGKKKIFMLTEVLPNRRIKTHQSGDLDGLWKFLIEKKDAKEIWVVGKAIEKDLPNVKKHIQTESASLPVGIPYIQAVTIN
ncbi:hypothetical protein KHA96_20255 [Bacillus sp. FJAT-49711]|uniref:hypothetical protein n=1 Tax=Bacillus sp. FJAT-49711 TaxID=2833585 RepID=UPI001BC9EFA2|nr:hypothetical protein [Bacillus sp. FJAT-49711]MBS4220633.1 hypothetical protein [Bacillus sp. FJAT-49711]